MKAKTAISIDRALLAKVEKITRELDVTRSGVVSLALEEFVERHTNRKLLAAFDQAYKDQPPPEQERLDRVHRKTHRKIVEGEW